jgi:hypothetical protein
VVIAAPIVAAEPLLAQHRLNIHIDRLSIKVIAKCSKKLSFMTVVATNLKTEDQVPVLQTTLVLSRPSSSHFKELQK